MIHKLQDNVHEHEAYNENFSECAEWVNTLARRLQVCADMAGDKHDVEDRLAKLQVLQQQNTKHMCNCLLYQNNITFDSKYQSDNSFIKSANEKKIANVYLSMLY